MKIFLGILIFTCFVLPVVQCKNTTTDSLLAVYRTSPSDTVKVKCLLELSNLYNETHIDSGLVYAKMADSLAQEAKLLYWQIKSKSTISFIYSRYYANNNLALEYMLKAKNYSDQLNDTLELIKTYQNLGKLYGYYINDYEKAIELEKIAIHLAITRNKDNFLFEQYVNLANYYFNTGNLDKSLEVLEQENSIAYRLKDTFKIMRLIFDRGDIYREKKQDSVCISYYNNGFELLKQMCLKDSSLYPWLASNYGNSSIAYVNLKEYSKAIAIINEAIKIDSNIKNDNEKFREYDRLVYIYKTLNNWNIASSINNRLINYFSHEKNMSSFMETLQNGSEIAFHMGDYRNAYMLLDSFEKIKQNIDNNNTQNKLAQLESNVVLEQKEKEIAIINKDKEQQKLVRNVLFGGIIVVIMVIGIILYSYIKNKKANKQLAENNRIIQSQKMLVEVKNKEITDNINYALRIQNAILPNLEQVRKALNESFILYLPKDIVSGDFYGFVQKNKLSVIVAADCTGHGVSGALMSMIGSSHLNQIINEKGITEPFKILNELNTSVIDALRQQENESNDGMDIAICTLDIEHMQLQFAGANRPLWLIRHQELIIVQPDKFPIGGLQMARERTFTNHTLHLQTGDTIYIFSDGYADQFGGEKGKKMMTAKFKEKLLSIQNNTMSEQMEMLNNGFQAWKGTNEQVDDVLVIGIRV